MKPHGTVPQKMARHKARIRGGLLGGLPKRVYCLLGGYQVESTQEIGNIFGGPRYPEIQPDKNSHQRKNLPTVLGRFLGIPMNWKLIPIQPLVLQGPFFIL